jgi:hypothetical protein
MLRPFSEISPASAQSAKPARLNPFQQLARQWDQLHPYNGIQIIRVRGSVDPDAANLRWRESLESLGLGAVHVADGSYFYSRPSANDAALDVNFLPPNTSPNTSIDQWSIAAMNAPFPTAGHIPFRPVVIQRQTDFWMGICYHHWLADSVSIRMLLREWFVRLFDPSALPTPAPRIGLPGRFPILDPQRELWAIGGALLDSLRWQHQLRRTRRIEDAAAFADLSQRCRVISLPENLIAPLREKSKAAGVTVNDIFLAAIAETCHHFVPAPIRRRRTRLAIGTIVDLRPFFADARGNVFDLLLGFTNVSCRPQDFSQWNRLLASVASQTRRNKTSSLPQASWLRMMAGVIAGRKLEQKSRVDFYRKRISLAGANSNVNMNRCWAAKYFPDPLLQYLRIAPTGPMTPIVFATTTLGSQLSLTITYRPGIVPEEIASAAADMFVNRLRQIAGE